MQIFAKTVTLPPVETSVELQEPFSYSPWFLIITAVLAVAILIFEIIYLLKHKKPVAPSEKPVVVAPVAKDLAMIKQEYFNKLAALEQNLPNLTLRKSYQELSEILRMFVFEATSIKVQNYSLQEIRNLNMPALTNLVAEYYAPEFAFESRGDIRMSIEKAKQLIWYW